MTNGAHHILTPKCIEVFGECHDKTGLSHRVQVDEREEGRLFVVILDGWEGRPLFVLFKEVNYLPGKLKETYWVETPLQNDPMCA